MEHNDERVNQVALHQAMDADKRKTQGKSEQNKKED